MRVQELGLTVDVYLNGALALPGFAPRTITDPIEVPCGTYDIVIVAAKTDPENNPYSLALLIVERGMEGFERGRNLDKMGMHAQDTAELFFQDVRVPRSHVLGDPAHAVVRKRVLPDLDRFPPPPNPVVPNLGVVHDRASVEVMRGCVLVADCSGADDNRFSFSFSGCTGIKRAGAFAAPTRTHVFVLDALLQQHDAFE